MQYMMNWMSLFWLFCVILCFWNFSRNRLAGDESPPGNTSFCSGFGVPVEGLPGDTPLAARQRKWIYLDFYVFLVLDGL